MSRNVGLQLYTLGDEIAGELPDTLRKVADIGFREVEFPQFYGSSGETLRRLLDDNGLSCPSIHVLPEMPIPGLLSLTDIDNVVREANAIGARYVTTPIFPFPIAAPEPDESLADMIGRIARGMQVSEWARIADMLNHKGALLAREGIHLAYHNHNAEFLPLNGGTVIEYLLAHTDPQSMSFEVDIGWVATAGCDAAAFIERHGSRIPILHMKDLHETPLNHALFMNPADLGTGRMDLPRVLEAARKAGVRHYIVEQEPPFTKPRLESARIGFEFMQRAFAQSQA
jgi:sugar phosphate isomerase/epimerase